MQDPEARWVSDGATQLGTHQDREGEGGAAAKGGAGDVEEASDRNEGAGSCSTQCVGVCDAKQLWRCLRPTAGECVEEEFEAMWIAAQASLQPTAQFLESCVGDGEFTSGPGSSGWTFHQGVVGDLCETNRQVELAPVAEGCWMREQERKEMYRCGYCGQLVGCSERGVIGMVSMKMLRSHEKNCANNSQSNLLKDDIINCR